jgi:hypothetical protein
MMRRDARIPTVALTALAVTVACGTPRQPEPSTTPAEPVPAATPPAPPQSPRSTPPTAPKKAPAPKPTPTDSVEGGRIIWQSAPIAAP